MKETDLQCICAKGSAQKDSVRAVSVSVSHCETLPGVRSEPRLPLLRPALQATIEVSMLLQKPQVGQGKKVSSEPHGGTLSSPREWEPWSSRLVLPRGGREQPRDGLALLLSHRLLGRLLDRLLGLDIGQHLLGHGEDRVEGERDLALLTVLLVLP